MRTAREGRQVAYNAQIAVDGEHKLIAAFDLTNEGNDERQLLPMAQQAKQALDVETLTVVADTGYSNGEQASQCAEAGITGDCAASGDGQSKGRAVLHSRRLRL